MVFTKESRIVQDYVLLISKGLRTKEDVPNLFNLKEVVEQCLSEQD